MITFFTCPKPFKGKTAIIQTNAIRSWRYGHPDCQIILVGDEDGNRQIAEEYDCLVIPDVKKTELGTPLVNDVFKKSLEMAKFSRFCYINSDIILASNIDEPLQTIEKILSTGYLIVGQRIDLDINGSIYLASDGRNQLRNDIFVKGIIHPPCGMDYFIFNKNFMHDMPDFAIGRPRWDNWMITKAKLEGIPVVDATSSISAIHQNHDYGHVPGGNSRSYEGPEAEENVKIFDMMLKNIRPDREIDITSADFVYYSSFLIKPDRPSGKKNGVLSRIRITLDAMLKI